MRNLKTIAVISFASSSILVTSCNTMAGIGRDVAGVGKAMTNVAESRVKTTPAVTTPVQAAPEYPAAY